MRILLYVTLGAAAVYGGYWFVGSTAVESGATQWFEDRRAEGWVADYSDLSTVGFPSRFDTTITDLTIADPDTGVAWSTEDFKLLALSYRPHHIIAEWPETQTISTPFQTITATNTDMRASAVFEPDTQLALDRANLTMDGFGLASTLGWGAEMDTAQFAIRQTVARANTYDVAFTAQNLRPDTGLRATIDAGDILPDAFDEFRMDATVGFDAPWDRTAIEDQRPQPTSIELKTAKAKWGALDLSIAGDLTVDGAGYPTGQITVRAENWRDMLTIAERSGLVPTNILPTVEGALGLLASTSGTSSSIDAPITFKRGGMFIGFLPLGSAPRLVIR